MSDPRHCRVLVVDDDPAILHATSRVLTQAGYAVRSAASGEAAWQAVCEQPTDLVLLDRQLPDVDGIDICHRIKGSAALTGTLVIMLSGHYTGGEEQAAGLDAGADGYITRPIENRELLARVDAYARLQQVQAESRRLQLEAEQQQEILISVLEDAQTAAEEQRTLIDALPDVVMRFDRNGRHRFVSANVATVMDRPAATFIGKTPRELGYPEAMCAFLEAKITAVFSSGQSQESEIELATPHGRRTFNWCLMPDLDAQSQVRSVLSLARDITERKTAEVERAAQLDELRRWQQVTLGREGRILSVKKEINDLLAEHGQPPRYPSTLDEGAPK